MGRVVIALKRLNSKSGRLIFSHPDSTVGTGITPVQFQKLCTKLQKSRAITAGGEFHPAPKITLMVQESISQRQ